MNIHEFLQTQPKEFKSKEYDFEDRMPIGIYQGQLVDDVVTHCPQCILTHARRNSIKFTKRVRTKANKIWRLECTARWVEFEANLDDIEEFHFNGKDW